MKHLKRFNESVFTDIKDYKEFCNSHLAYLADIGFKIGIYQYGDGVIENIIDKSDNSLFSWNDVKDDMIPFFDILKDNYAITDHEGVKNNDKNIIFREKRNYTYQYKIKLNDVLNDDVTDREYNSIVFYVK